MHVLISGPSAARDFLQNLAAAVPAHIADVHCRYDLARPSQYERWQETEMLVPFAIQCTGLDMDMDMDMDLAPRLAAIVIPSIGHEGIDIGAATERSIAVANGNVPENAESVAEAAFMFMLMALYRVHEAEARLRAGMARTGTPMARMLKGKTVGLIGYGNIAQAFEIRLTGWGANVLVSTRRPIGSKTSARQCDLEILLAQSDIVLPLLPLTNETQGLLSKNRLLQMKQGAVLVNLSRGGVIEESALVDPIVVARLGGLALDVFEVEPLPNCSPLRSLDGAILTGHDIAHTRENLSSLLNNALTNIIDAAAGRALKTSLNTVIPKRIIY